VGVTYLTNGTNSEAETLIVLMTYNEENYIEQAVQSLLNQVYQNFTLLIFDDGSNFDIKAKVIPLIEKQHFDRVEIFIQSHNLGVERHHSYIAEVIFNRSEQFVAFLNGDDYWEADWLEFSVNVLREKSEISVVSSKCHVLDVSCGSESTYIAPRLESSMLFNQDYLLKFGPPHLNTSTVYRFSSIKSLEILKGIDYEKSVACLDGNKKLLILNKILATYRKGVGISSVSSRHREWVERQHLDACTKFVFKYPGKVNLIMERYSKYANRVASRLCQKLSQ
jgi:glycosyltransferase involved in cell wall biosynthesis